MSDDYRTRALLAEQRAERLLDERNVALAEIKTLRAEIIKTLRAELGRLRNPDPDYTLLKSFTFTESN